VSMEDGEYAQLQQAAKHLHMPVGEFFRRELRQSYVDLGAGPAGKKLAALQRAMAHTFPTCDIGQMNEEIEAGYQLGLK